MTVYTVYFNITGGYGETSGAAVATVPTFLRGGACAQPIAASTTISALNFHVIRSHINVQIACGGNSCIALFAGITVH